jgi:hypothetical protein
LVVGGLFVSVLPDGIIQQRKEGLECGTFRGEVRPSGNEK